MNVPNIQETLQGIRRSRRTRVRGVKRWKQSKTRRNTELDRVRRRLALYASQGLSHTKIAKRLGVTSQTISRWIKDPETQVLIQDVSDGIYEQLERRFLSLDSAAMTRMSSLMLRGSEEVALEAVKLYWQARGRHNPSAQRGGGDQNVINNIQAGGVIANRGDAVDLMQVLKEYRAARGETVQPKLLEG